MRFILTAIKMKFLGFKNILKTLALALIIANLESCGSAPTDAPTLLNIKQRDKIIVGVKTDYTPYGFIDKSGKNAGLEIDIARNLAKEIVGSEQKIEFVPVTASNRIELLKQGKVDLVLATMTITDERRRQIDFSEPYYAAGTGLLARKDSKVSKWEDLKGKKVCGIQGSFYNKDLTEMGIQMVNFPGTAEAYTALKDGRCVGFAYDNSALVGKLLEPDWAANWHQALPVILTKPWGAGMRKGDTELLHAVDRAIVKMEAAGAIVNSEQKWKIPPTDYAKERMKQAKKVSS
jgi:polar amino acid transport system substrate-binding protein